MNISYKWLKRYIDTDLTPEKVAEALTSLGLEVGAVEQVETIKGGLRGLVVGQVVTCIDHPNSDHLHITTVNLGDGNEPVQIVCGAPNVAAGQKVIVATIGTKLYDGDKEFTIKRSKMRGEESLGMICAPNSKWSGRVVVRVTVNPRGQVTKANAVSATGDLASHPEVRRACEQAALKSSFSVPKNTMTEGIGTVTYIWH